MDCTWDTMNFLSFGLQIAATLTGGALALAWVRVEGGHLMVNTQRLSLAKQFGVVLIWMMAIGFILQLWYQVHLLGTL